MSSDGQMPYFILRMKYGILRMKNGQAIHRCGEPSECFTLSLQRTTISAFINGLFPNPLDNRFERGE
jgi:hypothetical protein